MALAPHVGRLRGAERVEPGVVTPLHVELDAVGRVGQEQPRRVALEHAGDDGRVGAVAARYAVLAEDPDVAGPRHGDGRRLGDLVGVGGGGERAQGDFGLAGDLAHLVLGEAGEQREVAGEGGEDLGELGDVELAVDPVEGDVEGLGLLVGEVEFDDGDLGQADALGGLDALVAADDEVVGAAHVHRLGEAERPQALAQRRHLRLGHHPGVVGGGTQSRDRDVAD